MLKVIDSPVLPKEIFAVSVKPELLSQAVRVHLANQRQGTQSSLTRAEVSRTRKKLYKQKGTGGARHGDRKAPIFVGGGIAFAPKPRDHSLSISKDMRRKSIKGALTQKLTDKSIFVVSGFPSLTGKTSELVKFLKALDINEASTFIITDEARQNVYRAGQNIANVTVSPANHINAYEMLKAKKIVMMEEAIETLEKFLIKDTEKTNTKASEKDSKVESKKVVSKPTVAKKVVTKKAPVKKS
jgi:large subunit ribosomal protein L4